MRRAVAAGVLVLVTTLGVAALAASQPAGGSKGEAVAVERDGRPCPPIEQINPGLVEGGCVLRARGRVRLSVTTLVGKLTFARCEYTYRLHVDGRGRTELADVVFDGPSPCNDAFPCVDGQGSDQTMNGRLELASDGTPIHVIDGCFDTCMGRFDGRLEVPWTGHGRSWREQLDGAAAGVSGWQIDGAVDLRSPAPVEIKPRPSS
jgi:hypothetical protein